uniref:SH3 and PX domains 2B n=1 Tax=Electrophorus electricus TaxID=8005 RepID=A0A4W4ERV6_ELEEL
MPRRSVNDVTVQDVQKRRNPSKHYVYIIKVSWSDGSNEVIYRRYSKFFDLQMELLDKFPVEGGQKDPKQRIIPFLPGKILFRRSHIRDVAMKRLGPINEYCRALTQLPLYLSQCEEVRLFFETLSHAAKGMWSISAPCAPPTAGGDSASTDPLLLDQYVAVSDYEKQESSEISLHVGQVVEVIEKNESGWWFVSSEDAQGWVPATCLEAQDDPDDFSLPAEEEEKYTVLYPYTARDQDEFDLEKGMTVEVIQRNLEGWWKIRYQDQEGWAPASYLKKADILSQKASAGGAAHASTNDLDGVGRQQAASKENKEDQRERFSPFSEFKLKAGARQRPPPRRDLSIPRGMHLPTPPLPPQVEEEYYTIADFQTTIPDGISFQAGVKVEVIEKNSSGWWYIQIEDKEGWAPVTFLDKYKKTSSASRPNFLAPLPGEMAQMKVEDDPSNGTEDNWSKPLPDEPSSTADFVTRPKLRDWKSSGVKSSSPFSGPLPPAPSIPPAEEKPALPPRRESINKSLELEEKSKSDLSKPLAPKPLVPGAIMPCVPPKAAPIKPNKPPEPKKDEKVLPLRNEMGLECGHKVSAKEVKKFNLKPVSKQPAKSKSDGQEEKTDSISPVALLKPKPVLRPKPAPSAKPELQNKNELDIINLRSKLRPPKPAESTFSSGDSSQHNGIPSNPSSSALDNGRPGEEQKCPPKQQNGHNDQPEVSKLQPSVFKEPPQRPGNAPRRPPPPKKGAEHASTTETKVPQKDGLEAKPAAPPQSRPPPPKPKAVALPASKDKEKEETKLKVPVPPKPLFKGEKPGPPRDKLPPLVKDPPKEGLFLAVADFEGDDQTPGFKEGTVFEVMEKSSTGWWFCKNISGGSMAEGWIPSNYLTKKH